MISTADAATFLDYLCGASARVDNAVLIDAPWGAGKTHFIRSYLETRDASARKADELIGAPFLYASLYGVSSFDEIREQFLAQAYPLLSSVPAKMIGTALAGMLNKWAGIVSEPPRRRAWSGRNSRPFTRRSPVNVRQTGTTA